MADNYVANPGSGGQTFASDDIGGVQHPRVKIAGGPDGVAIDVQAEPFGALQVNAGFQSLFYDAWSSSPIDTTDKWTVTGTAPTIANGNMTMSSTASTFHAIQTKDTVRPNAGFTLVRNGISIEAVAATGAGRFWGLGTPSLTPSTTSLVQNGLGYEIDQTTGALLAVTYAGGVRTTVATLTRPSDGATHAYGMYFRVTQAYWVLDGVQVASVSFPNVQVVELPALIVRQNGASFDGIPVFVNIAHLTSDTSRQGTVIADPIIGTRQARVDSAGALKVVQAEATTRTTFAAATVIAGVTAVTTEALLSMVPVRSGVAAAAATSFAATTGKRLRLQIAIAGLTSTAAAAISGRLTLRTNPSGAVTTTSPILAIIDLHSYAALAQAGEGFPVAIPDGIEFTGTEQFGITQIGSVVTGTFRLSVTGYEY